MYAEMWTDCLTERAAIKVVQNLKNSAFADLIAHDKGSTMTIHCCIADLIDLKEEIDKFLSKRQTVTQKNSSEESK